MRFLRISRRISVAFLLAALAASGAWCQEAGGAASSKLKRVAVLGDGRLRHASQVTVIVPLSDGKRVLTGSRDNTLRLWNLETGEELRRFVHADDVWGAAVRAGEKTCISSGMAKALVEWDLESGKEVRRLEGHSEIVFRCAVSPDGQRMLSGANGPEAFEWSLAANAAVVRKQKIGTKDDSVYGTAWSKDGKRYALAGKQKQVWLFDAETGDCIRKFDGHTKEVFTIQFSPDDTQLLSTSSDKSLRLWNVADGKALWSVELEKEAKIAAFSPDGTRIAAGVEDGSVRVLSVADGKELRKIDVTGEEIWPVAFSTDGRSVFSGGACAIRRHDAATGARLFPAPDFDGPCSPLKSMALLSPTGLLVCASSTDKLVFVIDPKTGAVRSRWPNADGINELQGCADGSRIFGRQGKTFAAWDTASGKQLWTKTLNDHPEALVASRDGKSLMLLDNRKHTILSGETGDEIRTLATDDNDYFNTVVACPEGRLAAACTGNGALVLYRLPDLEQVGRLALPVKIPKPDDKDGAKRRFPGANGETRVEYVRIVSGAILPRSGVLLLADDDHYLRQWRPRSEQGAALKADEIRKAVGALGDESFAVRQEALRRLSACDESILPALDALDVADNQELAQTLRSLRGSIATRLLPTIPLPHLLKFENRIRNLKGHPDGNHWAALEGDGPRWVVLGRAAQDGLTLVDRIEDLNLPNDLAFSADGRFLYTVNGNCTISVYEMEVGPTQ